MAHHRFVSWQMTRLAAIVVGTTASLVGCLPAPLLDARLDVAVVGAPADDLVPGAAAAVDAYLRDADGAFDLVASSTLRFLEARRGLVGSRVEPGAASIGRSTGGDVVVIVSASTLTRSLIDEGRTVPFERLTLVLDARLVSSNDATLLGVLASPAVTLEGDLTEAILPPLDEDPLLAAAIRTLVDEDLGPALVRALNDPGLTRFTGSGSSGE